MELEVGDIVLSTVEKIEKTVVFVKIPITGREIEGSIILSEIAPGRIRNLRDYVVPKKRIVCKVIRITPRGNIELSLRRVTQKEKKEILEQYNQEKSYISILKTILKENVEKVINEILNKKKLYDFFQEAKENSGELEKIVGKTNSKKILEILKTQKKKRAIIKKEIFLTTTKPDGLELIKNILNNTNKEIKIKYISAGRYVIKTEAEDLKTADNKLKGILNEIGSKAKKQGMEFHIKEK